MRDRSKSLLANADVMKALCKETIFGLEQLRDRIRDDGSVIPLKNGLDND